MLAAITWVLLACVSVTAAVYLLSSLLRKRRPGEPPIVKGSLIWGSAIDFNTHAVNFLQQCHKKYGDVFTLRLINQHLTVIMDPHSYEVMSKERNFDFDPIQKQVNWNVFSFVLKEPRKMIKDTGRTVRGSNLHKGMEAFVRNLDMANALAVNTEAGPDGWHTRGLRMFASETVFDAIFNTIFGRDDGCSFNSARTYKNFEVFHKYFNYFWLGIPKKWFPPAMEALIELLEQPTSDELLAREDASDYIKIAATYMKMQGQTEGDIKGHNLVYLHVSYNTFRLAFWVLSNILENPKAAGALMAEINEAINDRHDEDSNTSTFTIKDVEDMKVLNSIVQESSRLASGVFMVRYINDDTWFTTESGYEYMMRKGDRVAIYPPAIHKNPEIFEEPTEFKYDRFVDTKFYTPDGKELKHPVMAFGTLCPGKRYALLQLKWYILNTMNRFQMEQVDGQHAQYDYQYHGHEILPPVEDVQFRFRERDSYVRLELLKD